MKKILLIFVSTIVVTLVLAPLASAQWFRGNLKETLRRLEEDTDRFTKSLDSDLDHSALNGTHAEDEINRYVHDFEEATDHLKNRFDDREASPGLAREVLARGRSIDAFMRRNRPGPRSMSDWVRVRQSLDRLANAYRISWRW
jgi:hypothetical protein